MFFRSIMRWRIRRRAENFRLLWKVLRPASRKNRSRRRSSAFLTPVRASRILFPGWRCAGRITVRDPLRRSSGRNGCGCSLRTEKCSPGKACALRRKICQLPNGQTGRRHIFRWRRRIFIFMKSSSSSQVMRNGLRGAGTSRHRPCQKRGPGKKKIPRSGICSKKTGRGTGRSAVIFAVCTTPAHRSRSYLRLRNPVRSLMN